MERFRACSTDTMIISAFSNNSCVSSALCGASSRAVFAGGRTRAQQRGVYLLVLPLAAGWLAAATAHFFQISPPFLSSPPIFSSYV